MMALSQTQRMKIDQVFYPGAGGAAEQGEPGSWAQIGIIDDHLQCGIQEHPSFLFGEITNRRSESIPNCNDNSDCPNYDPNDLTRSCVCDTNRGVCISYHATAVAAAVGSVTDEQWTGAPFATVVHDPFTEGYADNFGSVSSREEGGAGVVMAAGYSSHYFGPNGGILPYDPGPTEGYDPVVDSRAAFGGVTTFKSSGNEFGGDRFYVNCSLASICVGGVAFGGDEGEIWASGGSWTDSCNDGDCSQLNAGCIGADCPERPHVVTKSSEVQLPSIPSGEGSISIGGTSFSAPMVAGLAALMWSVPAWHGSVYPGVIYSPETTKAVLMASADLEGKSLVRYDSEADGTFGAGIPQADRIVEIAENEQSGRLDLRSTSFSNDRYVVQSGIVIPVGHKLRAVLVQGSCYTDGQEHLASNIDLELVCGDQQVFADSRSQVNEYEILEYTADTSQQTCSLVARLESWRDCIQWLDPDTGEPLVPNPDSIHVGYAYYITSQSGSGD